VAAGEIRGGQFGGDRADHDIGLRLFVAADRLAHDGKGLQQHVEGTRGAGVARIDRDVHRDHEIGAEAARGTHRYRADQAAIDIVAAVDVHRLEYAGYGGRGAHRHAGVAAAEERRLAALQIGGDHGKAARKLFQRTVGNGAIDEVLQRFALENAAVRQRPVADLAFVDVQGNLLQFETGKA
jgi:hypothetical protein